MNKNKILSERALSLIGGDIEVLKNMNIHHFGYREFLNDGTSIGFCTHQNWSLLQNKSHIIEDMSNHYRKELSELGSDNIKYLVRYGEAKHESYYLNVLNNWQLWNSLVIYKREHNKIRGYYFISPNKNMQIVSSYINNVPFIDSVTNIIKPKIDKLIANCDGEFYEQLFSGFDAKLILEGKKGILKTNKKIFNFKINNHIEKSIYSNAYRENCFTDRQNKIIWLLVQKYSNKKIAKILGISLRTVEWHLVNIKSKVAIDNRQKLIEFLSMIIN